jgi:long-chain acyl-CoA synthetase
VVLREGVTIGVNQLVAFASERLASFKVPHSIVVVDEIPLGPSGKVLRSSLAESLLKRDEHTLDPGRHRLLH